MKLHSLALAVAILAATGTAAAADRGPVKAGTLSLGAERLTGIQYGSFTTAWAGGDLDTSVTSVAFLGQSGEGDYQAPRVYDMPRLSFDGFAIDGLSVGGSLMVTSQSYSRTQHSGNVARGSVDSSATDFLIAPRVGYATFFSGVVGIWPRGGFSFFSESADVGNNNGSFKATYFDFFAECPFLFEIVPDFLVTAGPTFSVTLTGSQKGQAFGGGNQSPDSRYVSIGLAAGLDLLF